MSTITLVNVPENIVQAIWDQKDFSSVTFDGIDYCIWDQVIATKDDQVAWLQWQIDLIQKDEVFVHFYE